MPTNPYQPPGTEKSRWPQFTLFGLLAVIGLIALVIGFFKDPEVALRISFFVVVGIGVAGLWALR